MSPTAGSEFLKTRSWGLGERGGDSDEGAGTGSAGGGAWAGLGGAKSGSVKKSVAGRSYFGPCGKRTRCRPSRDHGLSAKGAAPGRTLGTMTQTPAFDKPKVSASWGSGSRFQLPVWLVGVGASSLRERTGPPEGSSSPQRRPSFTRRLFSERERGRERPESGGASGWPHLLGLIPLSVKWAS